MKKSPLVDYPYTCLIWATAVVVCCLAAASTQAAPRVPGQASEVLEHLPMRPGDAIARDLAALRAEVRRAAAADPRDPLAATRLAERYFDLAMARGDPRYVGYADAVLLPFGQVQSAPLWALRGQLQQYRHGFAPALENFATALKIDPQFASAHAWRGAIYLVQADYPAARVECDALKALGRLALQGACMGLVEAYSGRLDAALAYLQQAKAVSAEPANRLWLDTRVGEVQTWRGQSALAEAAYRRALALNLDDGYLLAAWSDFLLDQQRPAEVVQALARWEASDTLLLRLALAETQLGSPQAHAHTQALEDRFAAAKQRGDTTHRAEEARFLLHLKGDAAQALQVAAANYQVQREPRDARILLEAALAAKSPAAAQPVLDWLARSGFEDTRLRPLAATLPKAAP